MKNLKKIIISIGFAVLAVMLFNDISIAGANISNPSIYGILTSDRWAYGTEYKREDLKPVPNNNPHPEPQPHRDHPQALAITKDGKKLYITLTGNEADPGNEVAVFDIAKRKLTKKIKVGSSPYYLGLHPNGKFLIVINRFSNYASVIDTFTDKVVNEIPLDFYCQYIVFNKKGTTAYISNRYINQIFVIDIKAKKDEFKAKMQLLGGFDEKIFNKKIYPILNKSCGTSSCHSSKTGGFYAGSNYLESFFSTIENSIPCDPEESVLLKAIRPYKENGFADELGGNNFHAAGTVVFKKNDKEYKEIAKWINSAKYGPGIAVGNFGSKPYSLIISDDEKYLYVGNLGTQDISVIDLNKKEEITGIYTQNIILDIAKYYDKKKKKDFLIAVSMGIGFGAAKERDPFGGETEDVNHPASQFSVIRDIETTEVLPIEKQKILGKFDAIDGTAAYKMTDIQNDVIFIDASSLKIPSKTSIHKLEYALKANRYEAHKNWVRYTSDSAEILPHEPSGDIPPELQRVIGAYPVAAQIDKDRLYTVMLGTYELVEWKINTDAKEPSEYLEPIKVYKTGIMPKDVVCGIDGSVSENLLFVSNFLGETISIIDRNSKISKEYVIGDLSRPFPDTNAEHGEMFVTTAVFSVDKDTSCTSCHINHTNDARGWGAGQAIAQMKDGKFVNGGLLAIPQIKNLFAIQPFYFEGTHTCFDAQFDDAREHVALQGFLKENPQGDFTNVWYPVPVNKRKKEHEEIQDKMSTDSFGDIYLDLGERRDEMIRNLSMKYFGKAYNFRDFQRFIGEFQAAETRLHPNPYDKNNPSVIRGRRLFNRLDVNCITCHKAPEFTSKDEELFNNRERVLPAIISFTRREKAFTLVGPHWMDRANNFKRDLEYWDEGRVERNQGDVTVFQLRGLFDRPFSFLHHGRAVSIREVIASPDHYSLRKFKYPLLRGGEDVREGRLERGFNELSFIEEKTYVVDTHGGTSHLNVIQIQDLENFLLSIE
jgi:DNA-binding beta-propeller fold protein YncE